MFHSLYLVIRRAEALERIYYVERDETSIGRGEKNLLRLPDRSVSRKHAQLVQTSSGFMIQDLGSRNGTRVNGKRVREARVVPTTLVEIGDYSLRAHDQLQSAEKDAEALDLSTFKARPPDPVLSQLESKLTQAQRRVYDVFLDGLSEKEVARQLGISINTVHTHSRSIYAKFGVSSRAELLVRCAQKKMA